jgi:4-aminobutyrate aminotransferase-like enzyme
LRFRPPLIINSDEINEALEIINKSLSNFWIFNISIYLLVL